MKIKEGFKLRQIAGETIISGEGVAQINFNKLITLNSSAALVFSKIEGAEFTAESVAAILVGEYEIDNETALKDSKALLEKWDEIGIIEK